MDDFHRKFLRTVLIVVGALLLGQSAQAQLTDLTQTPNVEGAGIHKSLAQQIGAGRGDLSTPDSSIFLINRDPFRSFRRGRQIFQRKFTAAQGLGPRRNDGVGDISAVPEIGAGLMDSCAGCHGRPKGSGGHGGVVNTRPDSRDSPHLFGLGVVEILADEMTTALRATRDQAIQEANTLGRPVSLPLASKGVSFGSIRALPGGAIDTSGVEGVDPDLRVRPFFAHGGLFSIREFIIGACQAEMGLEPPDPDLGVAAGGGRVVTPSGLVLDGARDHFSAPSATTPANDPDGDSVVNELPTSLVDHLEFYLVNYIRPARAPQGARSEQGMRAFDKAGCGSCHVPTLRIEVDRRVADVDVVHDPERGIFNNLFATATTQVVEVPDGSGFPPLKLPAGRPFVVEGIFSDLKRHNLGPAFYERNWDGTFTREFVTEPLWGVGTTAPYGHDGRSVNLEEVILRHGGEAQASRDAFAKLPENQRDHLIGFLQSLLLYPPDDTASNLDPGDRSNPAFPQRGHGSIKTTVLFNDPTDPE